MRSSRYPQYPNPTVSLTLAVISDLHIESPQDNSYAALLRLMREDLPDGSTLVLGGDIFDFLMGGPRSFATEYAAFFAEFTKLHLRRVTVHYIEGNHDFHLAPYLREHPNVHLHDAEVNLELAGKRIHVAHGDLIDRKDYGYRFLRGVLRSKLTFVAARVVRDETVRGIGARLGVATKELRQGRDPRVERTQLLFRNYAVAKFEKGFDFVILGHSHEYDDEKIRIGDRVGHYLNVGYPKRHKHYVAWTPGEPLLERKRFY